MMRNFTCLLSIVLAIGVLGVDALHDDYDECYKEANCFGFRNKAPLNDCVLYGDCDFLISIQHDEVKEKVDIIMHVSDRVDIDDDELWMAVGFSTNKEVEGTPMFLCTKKEDDEDVFVYYNEKGEDTPKKIEEVVDTASFSIDDGVFTCKFTISQTDGRDVKIDDDNKITINLDDDEYHILLAYGEIDSNDDPKEATKQNVTYMKYDLTKVMKKPDFPVPETYRTCGTTANCFGFTSEKPKCMDQCLVDGDCKMFVSITPSDDKYEVYMSGLDMDNTEDYLALGLSQTGKMGGSFIVACTKDEIQQYWAKEKAHEVKHISRFNGNDLDEKDGDVKCSFELDYELSVTNDDDEDETWNIDEDAYTVIMAYGKTEDDGDVRITKHDKEFAWNKKLILEKIRDMSECNAAMQSLSVNALLVAFVAFLATFMTR